ncbi:hypothetical protein EUGRSUZ_H03205 [Eucalyptus grandis]|uniref:Uncharacterized protein n=2 Tax=Eucalyptus grandis TaxID=71139 RepID=A0ACC3K312_EUCGR|nr:hypothetical protein EUGRSUZ_H03205 [Eucalyptus grandis]
MKTITNQRGTLKQTAMCCHIVIELHMKRRRKLTLTRTKVIAIVLTSQRPSIFPDEFRSAEVEAVTK